MTGGTERKTSMEPLLTANVWSSGCTIGNNTHAHRMLPVTCVFKLHLDGNCIHTCIKTTYTHTYTQTNTRTSLVCTQMLNFVIHADVTQHAPHTHMHMHVAHIKSLGNN